MLWRWDELKHRHGTDRSVSPQTLPPSTDIKQADFVSPESADGASEIELLPTKLHSPALTYARITCSHQTHLIHMHAHSTEPLVHTSRYIYTRASNIQQHRSRDGGEIYLRRCRRRARPRWRAAKPRCRSTAGRRPPRSPCSRWPPPAAGAAAGRPPAGWPCSTSSSASSR